MTTPLQSGGFITMTLPFVGGGAANLDGFLSQCETGQKRPSRQRRVSPGVSLEKMNTQITNKSSNLNTQFKCLCTTKYRSIDVYSSL